MSKKYMIEYVELDRPQSALNLLDEIDSTISKIEYFTCIGKILKAAPLQYLNYRILIVMSYLVFYVVKDNMTFSDYFSG